MHRFRRLALATAPAVAALTVLTVAPAFASGGSGGGGGGGTTAPTATAAPCADFSTFTVSAGRRPGGGGMEAVWTTAGAKSCASSLFVYAVKVQETNVATGQNVWAWNSYYVTLKPGQSSTWPTADNDWVTPDTAIRVDAQIVDGSGNVLASRSATVTTPSEKGII